MVLSLVFLRRIGGTSGSTGGASARKTGSCLDGSVTTVHSLGIPCVVGRCIAACVGALLLELEEVYQLGLGTLKGVFPVLNVPFRCFKTLFIIEGVLLLGVEELPVVNKNI